jgi:hypothetical protein
LRMSRTRMSSAFFCRAALAMKIALFFEVVSRFSLIATSSSLQVLDLTPV